MLILSKLLEGAAPAERSWPNGRAVPTAARRRVESLPGQTTFRFGPALLSLHGALCRNPSRVLLALLGPECFVEQLLLPGDQFAQPVERIHHLLGLAGPLLGARVHIFQQIAQLAQHLPGQVL